MTDRLLITGISGYLGSRVAALGEGWTVAGTYFSRSTGGERLDIRDAAAVDEVMRRIRPDAVIHTASGRDDWQCIADGSANVASAAARAGARLVHISSDAIFAGRDGRDGREGGDGCDGRDGREGGDGCDGRDGEYDEFAQPDPVYRYGAGKAAAETAVRAIDPAAAVVRTSLICGDGRGQHEDLVRDLIEGRKRGALFTDMIRKPVHVDDLARAVLELAAGDYAGVLNVAGPDAINRYDLGVLMAKREGLDPALIPAATIGDRRLPTDVRLCTDRARKLLGTRLRGVHEFMGFEIV